MAGETQEASTGWGGEFHVSTDLTTANLVELVEVVSFTLPNEKVDDVEKTHLKSPGKRKEYIAGMIDGGEVQIVINYRPQSDTDIAVRDWKDSREVRAVRFVIPENGEAAVQIDTQALCTGFDRGTVSAGDKMEATITARITGAETQAAAA